MHRLHYLFFYSEMFQCSCKANFKCWTSIGMCLSSVKSKNDKRSESNSGGMSQCSSRIIRKKSDLHFILSVIIFFKTHHSLLRKSLDKTSMLFLHSLIPSMAVSNNDEQESKSISPGQPEKNQKLINSIDIPHWCTVERFSPLIIGIVLSAPISRFSSLQRSVSFLCSLI